MVRRVGPRLPLPSPLALVDPRSPSSSSTCCSTRRYLHPNGQMPAYEWNFSDVNPPVHAWATYFVYQLEKSAHRQRRPSPSWRTSFHKLLKNFTWWVNRKDADGHNVFQGGFLGLDNIGVFDRSAPLPTGGTLDQADGTAWMALYCQNMLQIALELAERRPGLRRAGRRRSSSTSLWIALRRYRAGADGAGDVGRGGRLLLRPAPPAGRQRRPGCKVRSMVGLLPLAATTRDRAPTLRPRFPELVDVRPRLLRRRHAGGASLPRSARAADADGGCCSRCSTRSSCAAILARDARRGRVPRAPRHPRRVSRRARRAPVRASASTGRSYRVAYAPAESDTGMFGGNSNWRGPVWFPINSLLIRGAAEAPRLLRRRLHGRVPDRIGPGADPLRGRPRDLATG